jgi:hypothetical protein
MDVGSSSVDATPSAEETPASPPVVPTIPLIQIERSQQPDQFRRRRMRNALRVPVRQLTEPPASPPIPWIATAGHLMAYGGVGGLTFGAVLVLWSYFGGPAHFAPTGWLLTTVGQMLLFLGMVTLVAGSLERVAADMDRRYRQFAEQLDRLEALHRRRRRVESPSDRTAA